MPRLPLLLLLGAFIPGCTQRVWFTQPIREGFELAVAPGESLDDPGEAGHGVPARAPDDLQYFISDRIVLQREARTRHDAIADGRIVVKHGRAVEQLIVRRGTPGVAVDWGPDWVAVSFEKGTHLVFELVHRDRDRPGDDRDPASYVGENMPATYYRLRAIERNGRRWVDLGGREWEPVGDTLSARLKVKRTAWMNSQRKRRIQHGRRLH